MKLQDCFIGQNVGLLVSPESPKNHQWFLNDIVYEILKQKLSCFRDDQGIVLEIDVTTFDNCREYGYMYTLLNGKQKYSFIVYEHRNSDSVIINGCKTSEVKPYGAYKEGTKWDYIKDFHHYEFYEVAKSLCGYLVECFKGEFVE